MKKRAKPCALAEFRQKLTCKCRLIFQTLLVGDQLSIDPNPMYATGQCVQTGGAAGQIKHPVLGATTHGCWVKQHQDCSKAHPQQSTVLQAQDFRWLRSQLMNGLCHRHQPKVSGPVTQQMQAKTGIIEEGQMRTRVA